MNDIYNALEDIVRGGGRGVLAEITRTDGSAPRRAGARMLLGPDGAFSGTVGGGGLEYLAERDAREVYRTGLPLEKTYALGPDAGAGAATGAICGGSATLLFRPIGPAEAQALLAARTAPPRVLIYGAGHVGKALADALGLMDMPVTVTDERAGLLTPERFPSARRLLCPSMADAPMDPGPRDLVVIMTHGHAFDYDLTRRAMATETAYVGVVGSRRKSALFRRRLAEEEGFDPGEIEKRLRCPIGLPIGAQTPEEIAVSIAAQLIEYLHAPPQ